nr:50S ribosomal protein L27 [Candidatus Saccharibacteria bacterium]
GQEVKTGDIIIRQRGTKFEPGKNVITGKDFTIHATKSGIVEFSVSRKARFTGAKKRKTVVNVLAA